jgi:biotin carboxyl carrier protein
MDIKVLSDIAGWMKTTDLAEVVYRKDGTGFELRTEEAPVRADLPACSLEPVSAPAVGIYRLAETGKSRNLKEGMSVESGEELGFVEMSGEKKAVTSPSKGFLRVICIDDGKPVQYGQPLFFVEPR